MNDIPQRFYDAIKKRNYDKTKELFDMGPAFFDKCDINKPIFYGRTALLEVCRFCARDSSLRGFHEVKDLIKLLLENGSKPNSQSEFGNTAMHLNYYNLSEKTIEITKLLLQYDADINIANTSNRTLIDILCLTEKFTNEYYEENLKLLLNYGGTYTKEYTDKVYIINQYKTISNTIQKITNIVPKKFVYTNLYIVELFLLIVSRNRKNQHKILTNDILRFCVLPLLFI